MPGGLTLLAPLGLIALIATGIIVLIHMRQHTPPIINLPSLRFWQPVKEDSLDRRRLRRPPMSWPLILQVTAAILIGLALARPAIDALPGLASQRTTPQHVIVLLDGSTSMLATTGSTSDVTHWELARDETVAILDDWQAGDVVTVIVTGSRLHTSSASTRLQVETLRDQITRADAPGGVADIDAALRLGGSLVLPDRDNLVMLITDGALRPNPAVAAGVPAPIELRLVGDPDTVLANVAVTSIGYRPLPDRDSTFRLSFAISAYTAEAVRLPYRVLADGVEVVSSQIDLAAGETRPIEVTLPSGSSVADVVIDVLDPFVADNQATLLLGDATTAGLDILLISDMAGALERALAALPDARVDVFASTTPGIRALAAGYDLTVFHGITPLVDDMPETPMIFIRPPQLGDRFGIEGVMTSPVIDRFDAGSTILDGVDLAGVTFGDTPAYQLVSGEQELVRGSGNGLSGALIWRGEVDGERYVALGFDLQTSNITQRVAFPVLIARAVAAITNPPVPSVLSIGAPLLYRTSDQAASIEVIAPNESVTAIPVPDAIDSALFEDTGIPGLYTIRELGPSDQLLAETVFVINAGHPLESDLRANPDLNAALQDGAVSAPATAPNEGLADLWPTIAAIALAVIALEWIVFHGLRMRRPRFFPPKRAGGIA